MSHPGSFPCGSAFGIHKIESMKQTSLKITLASAFAAAMMTLAPAAVLSFPAAASAAQMGPEELYANFTGAVKNNRGDVVKKMLAQGYSPNVKMPNGDPALVYAIRADNTDVIDLLLNAKGLDVDKANPSGESALMVAAYKKNVPLVKALLAKGAIVDRTSAGLPFTTPRPQALLNSSISSSRRART